VREQRRLGAAAVTTVALLILAGPAAAQEHQPAFVGARVCGACHDGPGMGHQLSRWLLSRHAQAYASLASLEAVAMARRSGIPQDPHDAPVCLGCHATAADAEPWQREAGFDLADGVQCEMCHGPGSDYAEAEVMENRARAMAAGLRMPSRELCPRCHYVKGSHVAVHPRPQLDLELAWQAIAHPTPPEPTTGGPAAIVGGEPLPGPGYVGSAACAACHNRAAMNRQASTWRRSPHARAWASLATPRALELAATMNVAGDPQTAPQCLRCHSTGLGQPAGRFRPGFHPAEGVGCEACHGAGSDYQPESVMRDRLAARAAGLAEVGPATCTPCHVQAHGRPFDYPTALEAIAHPLRPPTAAAARPRYKTPRNLAFRPDGRELWVACEASGSVILVDPVERVKVFELEVGGQPTDVAFSPDGRTAYVSLRLDDSVAVVDVARREIVATIPVGDEPHGLLCDPSGATLFVLNTAADSISVVDTASRSERRRLAASRGPWSLALSPDGTTLLATNTLSRFVPFRTPSESEVTVVDVARERVVDRLSLPGANLVQGVAWHPSGELALVTLNRTKNLVPMTRIQQGWTITNGLGILWRDGTVDQVLLDAPNDHFADTADVTFSPDGRWALATSHGTDRVAVVDVAKLLEMVRGSSPEERSEILPNHLGRSTELVVRHIPTPSAPCGITAAPDGRTAWVASSLDDSLTVIDLETLAPAARVDLGGPTEVDTVRWGEKLFHSARNTFQRQFSCHSCHPDGHVDGLTYDIEADGIGISPVDNRTLRGILDTDPFKWEGTNPSLARQCGARLAVFFTRIQPFTPEELVAVNEYTVTIARPPNRYRPPGAELTPAQARGKLIFERTTSNDGRTLPVEGRCVTCHFPPYFTDRSRRDVGTRQPSDRQGSFDVPHLNNIYDSAPYLHDGIAPTLEEIWTRFNPRDQHGVTNDMTKDQLNDLIEYLKTL